MPKVPEQWSTLIGEQRRQATGGIEGRGEFQELTGFQPPTAYGALYGGPDVVGGPDPDTGPLLDQPPGLVGLVETSLDDGRVGRRLEGLGGAPRRRERRDCRQAGPDHREFEQLERARVHGGSLGQRDERGPDTDG